MPHDDETGTGRILGGRILKPINVGNGYYRVILSKRDDRKRVLVHRLVAKAFIPNPNGYPIINHIDEDPSNNIADNLEWCTQKHNINHGNRNKKSGEKHRGEKCYFHKLSEEKVRQLKTEYPLHKISNKKAAELAEKYDISAQTIKNIVHERTWAWLKV